MENESIRIWQETVEWIENEILCGNIGVGDRAPSRREISAFKSINPLTALKSLNYLEDIGVLENRRGMGMFVKEKAQEIIYSRRKAYAIVGAVDKLFEEAGRLGITDGELMNIIEAKRKEFNEKARRGEVVKNE